MDEQIIYYWDNVLDEYEPQEPKINDYIVHFVLINQYGNGGINEWICCDSMNKLIGLAKYVILPSIQLSRAIIKNDKNNNICFGTIGYDNTIELLNDIDSDTIFKSEYKEWFEKLENYTEEIKLEEIRDILNDINNKVDCKDEVLVNIEVYKNIKDVGLNLIKDYEEDGMIDILEDCFNFSKHEIENIFNNIDKNVFLLKRIMSILYNLNMI